MVVPHELHQKILVENHDVPTTGHVGINRTVDLIKRNYWWRGIWGVALVAMLQLVHGFPHL